MFAAPGGKMSSKVVSAAFYTTWCPEEESDEKDAGGKWSFT